MNSGSTAEKFAAIVNPEANLLKRIGPLHGPVPWKFVEKLFFNKGLYNKRSDSFGKGLDFEFGNCLWKRPTFLLLAPGWSGVRLERRKVDRLERQKVDRLERRKVT